MTTSAIPTDASPSRRGRRTAGLPLPPWTVDRARGEPLYLQLVRHLREMATTGVIAAGQAVPSSRDLARTLGVSRMTVVMAYELLTSEGLLEPRPGSGTVVCDGAVAGASTKPSAPSPLGLLQQPSILQPRLAPLGSLDGAVWRRAFISGQSTEALSCCDPGPGTLRLRRNIAAYLMLTRRIRCTADDVFVTANPQQAVGLLALTACRLGVPFHFEPFAPPRTRNAFATRGAIGDDLPTPVADDTQCGRLSRLAGHGLFVTPSYGYPSGATLSEAQRLELAAALDAHSLWAVEDYRDAEFTCADDLSTIYGLREGRRTIHLGTLSTVLGPYIQLSYVVAPPEWTRHMARERFLIDDASPANEEVAAELLETGMFQVTARSARQTAVRRHAQLQAAADRHKFWSVPKAYRHQGLHALCQFGVDPAALPALHETLGALDPYYQLVVTEQTARQARAGVVMGFAATPDDLIADQMRQLSAGVERFRIS
jgi:GntR family transcriptional regulator/MocR family aminotransferase